MPVTDAPTLTDRLTEARLSADTLEAARGVAALEGQPLDHAAIATARADIEAIEAAALEADRRSAAEQVIERATRRAEAAVDARLALADYTAATLAAEDATKALTGAVESMLASAKVMARSALAAGGKPVTVCEENEVRRTVSRLFAGELVKVGRPSGFGDLRWPSVPLGADWSRHIAKYVSPAIESAIERGKSYV